MLDYSSGRMYYPCSQEQGERTQGTMTPEPGWNEKEAQTVEWLCYVIFPAPHFPQEKDSRSQEVKLGDPMAHRWSVAGLGQRCSLPGQGPGPAWTWRRAGAPGTVDCRAVPESPGHLVVAGGGVGGTRN